MSYNVNKFSFEYNYDWDGKTFDVPEFKKQFNKFISLTNLKTPAVTYDSETSGPLNVPITVLQARSGTGNSPYVLFYINAFYRTDSSGNFVDDSDLGFPVINVSSGVFAKYTNPNNTKILSQVAKGALTNYGFGPGVGPVNTTVSQAFVDVLIGDRNAFAQAIADQLAVKGIKVIRGEAFTDPNPSVPGPNTSTVSALAPTPPKADALVASAKSALPPPPTVPTPPAVPAAPALPSVANIPSTPSLPSVSAPSVSTPSISAPSISAPSMGGITSGVVGGAVGSTVGTLTNNVGIGSASGGVTGGLTGGLTGTGIISGIASGAAGSAAGSAIGKALGGGIGGAIAASVGGAIAGGIVSKLASVISKWKPFHFSPSSVVKSKVDLVTGVTTTLPSTIPKGLPPISSITSQAPKVSIPAIPSSNIAIPSVSLPSAPSVSIPSTAIPNGIPTIPAPSVSMSTPSLSSANVSSAASSAIGGAASSAKGALSAGKNSAGNALNKVKGGVNRIQNIKIPTPPSTNDIKIGRAHV